MSDVALSMRAGLLRLEGRTLTADTRKGFLEVILTPKARLVWVPEASRTTEEVCVLLQGVKVVVELLPGPQRAVCVRKNGERHAFFWIQERDKSEGADERRVDDFNSLLENLCTTTSEEHALPAMLDQNQLAQTASKDDAKGSASNEASASFLSRLNAFADGSSQNQSQQASFLNRLNAFDAAGQSGGQAAAAQANGGMMQLFNSILSNHAADWHGDVPDVDLEVILSPDNVWDLIKDDDEIIQSLYEFMPENTRNKEDLHELIFSAQFRQTVQLFQMIVRNGDAGPLLAEMGIPPNAQGRTSAFLDALSKKYFDESQ